MFTLADFKKVVIEAKHPRILYVSVKDFEYLSSHSNHHADYESQYVVILSTIIRPASNMLDLSKSKFFHE